MPKDETADFFSDPAKAKENSVSSPDDMSKWIGVAEKTIGLFENIMAMKKAKDGGAKGGGETSAYEKGLAQGQNLSPQTLPAPQTVIPKVNYKVEEAVVYLTTAFEKLDKNKTIGEYTNGELTELKESGILNGMMEQFLKNFVEVSV